MIFPKNSLHISTKSLHFLAITLSVCFWLLGVFIYRDALSNIAGGVSQLFLFFIIIGGLPFAISCQMLAMAKIGHGWSFKIGVAMQLLCVAVAAVGVSSMFMYLILEVIGALSGVVVDYRINQKYEYVGTQTKWRHFYWWNIIVSCFFLIFSIIHLAYH
jgi:hypothetical protein